jgi:excisionase family DNA binding protein
MNQSTIQKEKKEEEKTKKTNCNTKESWDGKVYTNEVISEAEQNSRLESKTRSSNQIFENLIWLTSNEAAEYLRLPSVGALRVLVCKRRIPFHKLGRSLRFKRAELDRLLEVSRNGGL